MFLCCFSLVRPMVGTFWMVLKLKILVECSRLWSHFWNALSYNKVFQRRLPFCILFFSFMFLLIFVVRVFEAPQNSRQAAVKFSD